MKRRNLVILGVISVGVTAAIIAYKAMKQMSEEEIYDDEDDISFEDDVAYFDSVGKYPRQVETLDGGEYPLKNVNKEELKEAVNIAKESEEEIKIADEKLSHDYSAFICGIKNNPTLLPRLTEGVSTDDPDLSRWDKGTIELYIENPAVLDLYYFKAHSLLNRMGINIQILTSYIMTMDESKKTEKVKRIFGDLCLLGNKIPIILSKNRMIMIGKGNGIQSPANQAYNITLVLNQLSQFFHKYEEELIKESGDDEKIKVFISKIDSDLENGLYLKSDPDDKEEE